MLRKAAFGIFAVLALAILGGVAQSGDKDKEVKGTLVKVDLKASTLTVKVGDKGEEKTYDVNEKTKFIGPKGGKGDAGLKDDRLVPGAELRLMVAGNNRTLHEVHLPERKK